MVRSRKTGRELKPARQQKAPDWARDIFAALGLSKSSTRDNDDDN